MMSSIALGSWWRRPAVVVLIALCVVTTTDTSLGADRKVLCEHFTDGG